MGLFLHLRDHFFLFLFALSLSPFSLLLLRAFVVKLNPLFTFPFCRGSFSVPSAPPPCLRGKIKPTFYFLLLPWLFLRSLCASSVSPWLNITHFLLFTFALALLPSKPLCAPCTNLCVLRSEEHTSELQS